MILPSALGPIPSSEFGEKHIIGSGVFDPNTRSLLSAGAAHKSVFHLRSIDLKYRRGSSARGVPSLGIERESRPVRHVFGKYVHLHSAIRNEHTGFGPQSASLYQRRGIQCPFVRTNLST